MAKKITRATLNELAKEMDLLSEQEQQAYLGGGSGTKTDPYSEQEFDSFIISGHFPGGYVQFSGDSSPIYLDASYTIEAIEAIESKRKSYEFRGSVFYMTMPDVGIGGQLRYGGTVIIESGVLTVLATDYLRTGPFSSLYTTHVNTLEIYVNGTLVDNIPVRLDNNPRIYQEGHVPLGQASVNLTQYHGHVEIKFRRGYTHNSGSGFVPGADCETIYSKRR